MMTRTRMVLLAAAVAGMALPRAVTAQRPDMAALQAAQRAAQQRLAMMDGEWRGTAWTLLDDGGKHTITQTERVGTMLGGTVRVVEGRGYEADGTVSFNAFAVISWDAQRQAFSMRSHAQGMAGDYVVTPSADGFAWVIPAGPVTIRYTATIRDGTWHEVGDRTMPDGTTVRFFETTMRRIGPSTWPAGAAVGPR